MPPIRFRSRYLHATLVEYTIDALRGKGWIDAPVNFGADPVTVIDYQPDERSQQIATNTVAISLADYPGDEDEELGAAVGGLRSAPYQIYFDVYMKELALTLALCDDLRDIFTDQTFPIVDQISGTPILTSPIEIVEVVGPQRPQQVGSTDPFRRYWRIMTLNTSVYFTTW